MTVIICVHSQFWNSCSWLDCLQTLEAQIEKLENFSEFDFNLPPVEKAKYLTAEGSALLNNVEQLLEGFILYFIYLFFCLFLI